MQGLLQMKGNQGAGIMLVRAGLREHNRQVPGWLGLQAPCAGPEVASGECMNGLPPTPNHKAFVHLVGTRADNEQVTCRLQWLLAHNLSVRLRPCDSFPLRHLSCTCQQ